jgi:hypothetical protein
MHVRPKNKEGKASSPSKEEIDTKSSEGFVVVKPPETS